VICGHVPVPLPVIVYSLRFVSFYGYARRVFIDRSKEFSNNIFSGEHTKWTEHNYFLADKETVCKMSSYKLTYFNWTGIGEISRLIFSLAEVTFEDFRIERDEEYFPLLPPTWKASKCRNL